MNLHNTGKIELVDLVGLTDDLNLLYNKHIIMYICTYTHIHTHSTCITLLL